MTRVTLALLLALLAVAPLASVAGVGGTPALAPADGGAAGNASATVDRSGATVTIQANNTTRRLGLDSVDRANYSSPGLGLGSTVSVTGQEIDQGLRFEYLSVRTEQVDTAAQRRIIAEVTIARIRDSVGDLREREWAALQAYGNGEITEQELLHRLAVIHSAAEQLEAAAVRLDEEGADIRLDEFRLQAQELQTPLREQILLAATGEADNPVRVHVSGSDQGVVLQSLSESRFSRNYYREAVRFDNYEQGEQTLELGDFVDVIEADYPFIDPTEEVEGTLLGTAVYETSHEQGTVRLYNDGRTRAVYREYQSLRLSDLPRARSYSATANGTTVSVQTTPNGGPAKVVATNALTGNTISADVYIDGELVGQTGGGLWVLTPSDTYTVTVRTPEGSVSVAIDTSGATNGSVAP